MNDSHFLIADKKIGGKAPCFLIAEIAQAHDGSLGFAHSFIDAAADAGADAIKFQTHIAQAESTKGEKFRINFSYEDPTRYDYWKRMEFTPDQWAGLFQHAADRELIFLSSAFSSEAVDLLAALAVPAWKVGSGETNNPELLGRMLATGKPILLSTGMSRWEEITEMVQTIQRQGNPLAIFQCTSKYPNPLTDVGLNVLDELQNRYCVPVGLSDHSASIFPSLAAMAKNASLIEVHLTFHRAMFGPDVPVSLTFEEFQCLVEGRDAFHVMQQNPVEKDEMATELSQMRALFNKSVALKENQPQGTVLTSEMLTVKKPGTGIPAKEKVLCIGKVLKHNVSADSLLTWNDLQN